MSTVTWTWCVVYSGAGPHECPAAVEFTALKRVLASFAQVMYNYGSPRVGNYPFALMYDLQVPHSFRVVFDGDVVTGVPPGCRLYKHIGYEVRARCDGPPLLRC